MRQEHYRAVHDMGKKEYTLLKMQEYGFWPEDLPTPYERQAHESAQDYNKRQALFKEYEQIAGRIANLYSEKDEINTRLKDLRKHYDQTWDYEKIRKDVAQTILRESLARRAERKRQKELQKQRISEAWQKRKAESIVFIGRGYSGLLSDKTGDADKLRASNLPLIPDDKALAALLGLTYTELRFLAYHRDVVVADHYHRYEIPKKNGGHRRIAAPKPLLKKTQRKILELILEKIDISEQAHGFVKGRSVVTGAQAHKTHIGNPSLLITLDLEDFFPTITFERVRGLFKSFGYSGYIASLLAMICTYCERVPIEVKGQIKYVRSSERILPQGSPASPMITNIICRRMDAKIRDLATNFPSGHPVQSGHPAQSGHPVQSGHPAQTNSPASCRCTYTRYADDMSFSFDSTLPIDAEHIKKFIHQIQRIVHSEGFKINKQKTRYLKHNNRQAVTGIVINNEEISVPKVWLKKMRAALYNAKKQKEQGTLDPGKIHEIAGMACWLNSVNPTKYKKMIDEAKDLQSSS
ncbi:MAG: reverse transcriptase domain-containing protein [Peptococcaceae bacterium]|nr:reverse transcriptase domain-containing protein [Peptococcaceae bacterium]